MNVYSIPREHKECSKDMSKVGLVKPVRVASSANTNTDNEQDGFVATKRDMNEYRRSKEDLDDGLIQAYSIIISVFCTKRMKEKVEGQSDFTNKIENDPIELLRAKRLSMLLFGCR
jgi:hypothetical protein